MERSGMEQRRIVFTTLGSLGDLHPYIALALGLQARGHHCTIATSEMYREKVERQGIAFAPVRPNLEDFGDESAFMAKVMHPVTGSSFVIRQVVMPWIRQTYEDLMQVAQQADWLVGHPLTYALPLVAAKTQKPWMGCALQPMVLLSAYDPPVFGSLRWMTRLPLGLGFHRWFIRSLKRISRPWGKPIDDLRKDIGLPPSPDHPLLESVYSPWGNLALFSEHFGPPQPDWPKETIATGFPFHDHGMDKHHDRMSMRLEKFLDAGPPPIVFTLGSSAVMTTGGFYRQSFEAAKRGGFRAVLLIGRDDRNQIEETIPSSILIDNYAPYSQLFPRAAAVFHQGGMGTTAQVMRAGVPMVIVPFSHDQPDHAHRIEKLGIGYSMRRGAYSARRVLSMVPKVTQSKIQEAAKRLGQCIQNEDGVSNACDRIEQVFIRAQASSLIHS